MRINTNITAMNAHRNYGINNGSIAKSVEKLSSGMRINRAGDDAAGLAISEKMRAQIRGLNMASKNSQDAISLVQTAEGALQSTHNILQRMRELAVQSSSDTNEKIIDRGALQAEFAQLQNEIDDIADKTVFNDQKLIDGTFQKYSSVMKSNNLDNIKNINSANATAGAYAVTVTVNAAIAAKTKQGTAAKLEKASGTTSTALLSTAFTTSALKGITVSFTGLNSDIHNGNQYEIRVSGSNINNMTFQLYDTNNNLVSTASSVDTTKWGTRTASAIKFAGVGNMTITLSTAGGKSAITELEDLEQFEGKTIKFDTSTGKSNITSDAVRASMDLTINGETVKLYKGDTSATFKESGIVLSFNALSDADVVNKAFFGSASALMITLNQVMGSTMNIQTGANQGDQLSINIDSMDTARLGIRYTDISSREHASTAITFVNDALNKVSSQRAELGALQNRLEYKISNLDTSAENLSAAESRIRDVDMAKQMTDFSKQNILSQASTAMLAQANALPQGVLQLLG